jgi:predicted O-methyltransferase YrrM
MPEIAGRVAPGLRAPRQATARAYRRCARPIGLLALDHMLARGLPGELEHGLRVLLGDPVPPEAQALADQIERWRAQLSRRTDVYRYAYDESAAGLTRWPDDAVRGDGEEVSLRWLASAASVPAQWGVFLHLCAAAAGARTVLELGAGTGMSGAYLATAASVESFVTLEGSPPLARVAAETLAAVTDRGTVVQGRFEVELPRALAGLCNGGGRLDFAYVDGHHEEAATLRYVDTLRPYLQRGSIVVLDDIRLWRGMWAAWRRASSLPAVAAAVDTGRFGILVWGEEPVPSLQQFDLRRYTGTWRVGPPRPRRPAAAARPVDVPVSVVIPVWGAYAGAGLDGAIASIRRQGVPAEIVVVDNASDPPLRRPGVTIVRSPARVSVGAARNLGLAAVRSPAVVFWDADDLMLDGALARMLSELERRPELVACGTALVDDRSGERHHWPRRWPLRLGRLPGAFAALNAVSSLYPVIGAAIRTAEAREVGFPEVDGGDDWAMAVSLALRGRVAVDDRPGRLYRRHDDSLSAGWGTDNVLAHAKLVRARLREDPMVPAAIRLLAPAIWLGQHAVLRLLRPLARRTPARRRAGT